MPGIDESKSFIPLRIAVLTVSDTRDMADDKSGATLAERIEKAGHVLAGRAIVKDETDEIRARVKGWIDDKSIDVVMTTGGTGFTGRDVTPEAVEPLFEKKMDGFATLFLLVSHAKIGTSAIQTRATAGVANSTYIFCLPGSPGACKDAWDEILLHQLDYRYRPCNFVEILPRLDEHLRREKARGATASLRLILRSATKLRLSKDGAAPWFETRSFGALLTMRPRGAIARSSHLQIPELRHDVLPPRMPRLARREAEARLLINMPRAHKHAVRPQRDRLVAGLARKAHAFVDEMRAHAQPARFRIDQQKP